MVGMMCYLKKNALIFQVGNDIQDPIVVIEQQNFTNQEPDSSIPLLGIYDGTHYQSVLPASKEDEQLTIDMVKYFPKFQGNFKSYFANKANHQQMKKKLVPTIDQENFGFEQGIFEIEPTNSCDVPLSEEANFDKSNNSYEVTVLEQANSEIKLKDDGSNKSYEVPLSEQANSENEMKDFGTNNISEKETEGINSSYGEPVLGPENSEMEAENEGINISNEEPALEQENSGNEAKHEGIKTKSSYKDSALVQENSEIEERKKSQKKQQL